MVDPWFDPSRYAWIPGTLLGVLGGTLGMLTARFAPKGKARGLVVGSYLSVIVISVVLLVLATFAWYSGQPYGVWYGLGLAGLIGSIVFPSVLPSILMQYRRAEERQIEARDLD